MGVEILKMIARLPRGSAMKMTRRSRGAMSKLLSEMVKVT